MRQTMTVEKEIRRLEEMLLDDRVRSESELFAPLLDEHFYEYGKSGRCFDRAECLKAGTLGKVSLEIRNFSARQLAEEIVLATYRTVDRESGTVANRSSVWKRTDGQWRMAFHQGTPVPERIWSAEAKSEAENDSKGEDDF